MPGRACEPSQMPSTADAFNDGEHPERHQDFRIHGITSDASFDGPNLLVQWFQIERIDIRPYEPDAMIFGNQLIERRITPLNLKSFRPLDSHFSHGTILRNVGLRTKILHHPFIAPKFSNAMSVCDKLTTSSGYHDGSAVITHTSTLNLMRMGFAVLTPSHPFVDLFLKRDTARCNLITHKPMGCKTRVLSLN